MNSIPFGWMAIPTGETTENTGLANELINWRRKEVKKWITKNGLVGSG
jgi:hypothetical protein